MIHLVQPSLPTGSHTTLLSSPLLVSQLPLSSFVAEYFDLRITSVRRLLTNIRSGIFERVNLYVQWKTFHSFLCAEMKCQNLCQFPLMGLSHLKSVERHWTARLTLAGDSRGFQYTARALWESSSMWPTRPRLFLVSTSIILCLTWKKETSMKAMSIVNLDPVFNIKIYSVPHKRYFIQQNWSIRGIQHTQVRSIRNLISGIDLTQVKRLAKSTLFAFSSTSRAPVLTLSPPPRALIDFAERCENLWAKHSYRIILTCWLGQLTERLNTPNEISDGKSNL